MKDATPNLAAWLKAITKKRCLVGVYACEIKFHAKKFGLARISLALRIGRGLGILARASQSQFLLHTCQPKYQGEAKEAKEDCLKDVSQGRGDMFLFGL